jgi:AcrR family transcriptional regulator
MKTMVKRAMPVNETRDRILEAALALFRERGYAEATMREVAARAGVATGLA